MFIIDVAKNQAKLSQSEPVTSGSQNVYVVKFNFSEEWEFLERTAVFATSIGYNGPVADKVYNQLLGEENTCFIPWEVMTINNKSIYVGVFGTMDGNVVLPTIWVDIGNILLGVTTGLELQPPTPTLYEQMLNELYLIRRDIRNLEVGTSLEVLEGVSINNVNFFSGLDLPRSIILLTSSLDVSASESGETLILPFISDVVEIWTDVYADENQNESSALFVRGLQGVTHALTYNDQGFFTQLIPIKDTVDPDDFLANGTFVMHGFGENVPVAGTIQEFNTTDFTGRKPEPGEEVRGLGWTNEGNLYRFRTVVTPKSGDEDIWSGELTEVEWIKVVGADGFSPIVEVEETETGHTVKITDAVEKKEFDVRNGIDGENGFSPSIDVEEIEGGHKVTVNNKDESTSFNLMNGIDGANGEDGSKILTINAGTYIKNSEDLFTALGIEDYPDKFKFYGTVHFESDVYVKVGSESVLLDSDGSISQVICKVMFERTEDDPLDEDSSEWTDRCYRVLEIWNDKYRYHFETSKDEVADDVDTAVAEALTTTFSDYTVQRYATEKYVDEKMSEVSGSGAEPGSSIPEIPADTIITTGDELFEFLGVEPSAQFGNGVAVYINDNVKFKDKENHTWTVYHRCLANIEIGEGWGFGTSGVVIHIYANGATCRIANVVEGDYVLALSSPFDTIESNDYATEKYVDNAIASIDTSGGASLPSGSTTQVVGFDENGEAVAKSITNDMIPVVTIGHGGTSGTNASSSLYNLGNNGTSIGLNVDTAVANFRVFIFNTATHVGGSVMVSDLRKVITGTSLNVTESTTDYTTLRARAISLHTTMPTTGLVNGALYGIYT